MAPIPQVAGTGLAVVVNANAKRGGRRVAAQIARRLPGAVIRLTRSLSELESWLRYVPRPQCILSAGGDGSASALFSAMNHAYGPEFDFPVVGLLPLGTGNGWANSIGAPKLDRCLRILLAQDGYDGLPTRQFGLVACEGQLAPFAGSGWDAYILNDYKAQLVHAKGPEYALNKSVYGYLRAIVATSTPRLMIQSTPSVRVENLGDDAYVMTADGKVIRVPESGKGAILYEGPFGIACAGTTREYGYGFTTFPHGERMLGMINVRIASLSPLSALFRIRRFWVGEHPVPGMIDMFASRVRMTFSRPMPVQIAGDAVGMRRQVEFGIGSRLVRIVDWKRLLSPHNAG